MKNQRRTLVLRLRRSVRVSRRFDVTADPNDPLGEIQTCRECGHKEKHNHDTLEYFAKKLIAYRARGGMRPSSPGT